MLVEDCQRNMMIWCFLTELLQLKVPKSADIRRHKHFSWILHFSNSVRLHRIIIVLFQFLISIQWTIGLCKLIFNWAPLIFTQFEPHDFTCSEPCCAHIKKGYSLEASRTWHIQHEFSDSRCDIDCVWHNDNFLTRECSKNQIQAVFQCWLPGYHFVLTGCDFTREQIGE